MIISAGAAAELVRDGAATFFDCRFDLSDRQAGRAMHAAAHIPGAIFADLEDVLSDMTVHGQGRHPLPDPRRLAAWLTSVGADPARPIVVYDQEQGALAARLWWLLRQLGASDVRLLDGGWQAWQALAHHPALPAEGQPAAAVWSDAPTYSGVVDGAALRELLPDRMLLVDARAPDRFRGDNEPLDRQAGHVPGAVNRFFGENLRGGRWRRPDELRRSWLALLGTLEPVDVVHMCGSGVTACHNLLAMEYAGLTGSRLYAPSWSGWLDGA